MNRIRVLIAGNVYVKRALVRRFIEDDGYEVVGDVMTAEAVLPAIHTGRPDAIVLDEDLAKGGVPIAAIREAAPDARVVVFTAAAPGTGAPPPGADGYLDKGVGLSALTALLGRLFTEPTVPLVPLVAGGVGAAAVAATDTTEGPMDDTQPIEPTGAAPKRGGSASLARYVAIAAGILLIVWGVVSTLQTDDSGGTTETVAEGTTPAATGPEVVVEDEPTPLDDAYASLDSMIVALEDGDYIFAAIEAQSLMAEREQALEAGFATTGFDAEVTARLEPLVPTLPLRVNTELAEILGSLYPPFQTETGSNDQTQVLGETVQNDGDGSSTDGDQTTDNPGGNDGGGDDGGGDEEPAPQPGDGKVWGHSHKPPHGGWHGEKPPK